MSAEGKYDNTIDRPLFAQKVVAREGGSIVFQVRAIPNADNGGNGTGGGGPFSLADSGNPTSTGAVDWDSDWEAPSVLVLQEYDGSFNALNISRTAHFVPGVGGFSEAIYLDRFLQPGYGYLEWDGDGNIETKQPESLQGSGPLWNGWDAITHNASFADVHEKDLQWGDVADAKVHFKFGLMTGGRSWEKRVLVKLRACAFEKELIFHYDDAHEDPLGMAIWDGGAAFNWGWLGPGDPVDIEFLFLNDYNYVTGPDSIDNQCLWIDLPRGEQLDATPISGTKAYTFEMTVANATPDLDVDSDNNDGTGYPHRNGTEDASENVEGEAIRPGKILFVNNGDGDHDGIPNFADGYDHPWWPGESVDCQGCQIRFARMSLHLPDHIDYARCRVRFLYEASDPWQVTTNHTPSGIEYVPAPGALRIWRKDSQKGVGQWY